MTVAGNGLHREKVDTGSVGRCNFGARHDQGWQLRATDDDNLPPATSAASAETPVVPVPQQRLGAANRRSGTLFTFASRFATNGMRFRSPIHCAVRKIGGNLLTMGMTNPPACNKKGEPIGGSIYQH